MRSSVSADVQTLLEVFKKNEQLFLLARPTTIEGGPLVSREPFPLFFKTFFCSASSLKKMMDYPAWHSRSEGFVFRDYDGSRLSPLAVWIRGKKIVLFRRTEKDQPSRISTEVTYETRASQGDHPLDRPAELFSAPPLTRLSPIFRGSTRPFVAKPPRRKPPLARCSFPAARANIWFRRPGC